MGLMEPDPNNLLEIRRTIVHSFACTFRVTAPATNITRISTCI